MQSKQTTNKWMQRKLVSLAVFLFVCTCAFAQNTVTGTVKDQSERPIRNAFSRGKCSGKRNNQR